MAGALSAAERRLAEAGVPEPKIDAGRLLSWLLGTDRGGLLVRRDEQLGPATASRFATLVDRRAAREPLQYLTGVQEFYDLELRVEPGVFIPRPETEGVVDAALGLAFPDRARVLDVGTGSGCIVVALAATRHDLELVAVESSPDALAIARDNAERHELADRIDFRRGSLDDLPPDWTGRFHAVLSNPPYVPEDEWRGLQPEVRVHEPRQALVPGPTGLEAYGAIAPGAMALLRPGGWLILEIGFGQADAVRDIALGAGFEEIEVRPDLGGIPRVLVGRRPAAEGGGA